MTNRMALCVVALAVVFGQACSKKSQTETSDIMYQGTFIGDPTTTIKSDGKFLCDFQWTDGPKNWNYDGASGDNPVNEGDTAKEPWCLIPYGDSTEFFISAESEESVKDYVCRDLSAQYNLKNEQEFAIKGEYETHERMICVPINNVIITAKNLDINYKDERLYHIWINADGLYNIEGHINLRLVRPVSLNVIMSFIDIDGFNEKDINIIIDHLNSYIKKVGYELNDVIELPRINTNTDPNSTTGTTVYRGFLAGFLENIFYNNSDNYDRLIGVRYEKGKEKAMISVINSPVTIILDSDFFNESLEKKARLLASLLYSQMLGMLPTYRNDKYQNENYLSYYTTNLNFSQPSWDWKAGRNKGKNQRGLQEFASIMQHFNGGD